MPDREEPPTIPPGENAAAGEEAASESGGTQRDELLRLASVVAHQLKSPLSSVESVLATLLGGLAGPLEPRQRRLLEKALERCSTGVHLVRNLLRLRAVDRLDELPRDRAIVIVCSHGLRGYVASRVLTSNGFEDVAVLDGGLEAWPYAVERFD